MRCPSVPFLLDLARITGNETYQVAAIRLGHYTLQRQESNPRQQVQSFADFTKAVGNASDWYSYGFAGGACDNPNVLDKEAGVLALQAFLALHAATPCE